MSGLLFGSARLGQDERIWRRWETPSLLEPGRVYAYRIDLWSTSNCFRQGHRIRVEVASSSFPQFDRNPNTGHPFGQDVVLRKARQTVYHDAEHPSHVLLPVVPAVNAR